MTVTGQPPTTLNSGGPDVYPGGLSIPDPYSGLATWFVDAITGSDAGSGHTAGYTYKTIDAALIDVFPIGNPGNRRIVVKSTGTYYPGGTPNSNRGSYFPAGGPDAAHPCVIQGDPSNTVFPTIDAQLGGCSNITGITLGVTTTVTVGDPLSGPSRQPFAVGQNVVLGATTGQAGAIVGTTQLNLATVAVTATGGSAGAWTITFAVNSSGYGAWVSGGTVYSTQRSAFGIGNQGLFGTGPIAVANVVIRKLEMVNGIEDTIYFYNGTSSNINVEYCYFHGNRYPYSNPSSTGCISATSFNVSSGWTIRNCKFYDMGTRPGQVTTSGASSWSLNCIPIETYGTDTVTIKNCSFDHNYASIRLKLHDAGGAGGSGTANNWTITNNVFTQCGLAIMEDTQGGSIDCPSNWTITGNLCYGPLFPFGSVCEFWGYQGGSYQQGSNILWANNTAGEDVTRCAGWMGATGVVFRDNVFLGPTDRMTPDPADSYFTAPAAVVFSQLDYNVYGVNSNLWGVRWNQTAGHADYSYSTFAQWQAANTTPLGPSAPTPPPEFATTGDPDAHALYIPNLAASYNTNLKNFPNMAARNYTIAPGSPLLTGSSTGGRMGYDPTNSGPGW